MNALTHVSTLEVSTVKKGANRKKIAFSKEDQKMDVKKIVEVTAEGEAELVATLKAEKASDARIEAEVAIYRIKKNCADVLPKEPVVKVKEYKDETQGDDEDDDDYMKRAKKMGFTPKKKPAAKADVATDPRVEELFKANQAKDEMIKSLAAKVDTLVDRGIEQELMHKAETDFSHVPGSTEELAKILKSAREAGADTEKLVTETFAKVNQMMQKSASLMRASGIAGSGGVQGGAYDKIKAMAKCLTMKADNGKEMTEAQKVRYVITKTDEGKALYEQWHTEHPNQTTAGLTQTR